MHECRMYFDDVPISRFVPNHRNAQSSTAKREIYSRDGDNLGAPPELPSNTTPNENSLSYPSVMIVHQGAAAERPSDRESMSQRNRTYFQ